MKITTVLYSLTMAAVALGCSSDPTKVEPAKRGVRGESCLASNDCGSGLVCVSNVCSANDFPLEVEAKTCYQIDCSGTADCCEPRPTDCDNYEAICEDATSTSYDPYNDICYGTACDPCPYACEDSRCVVSQTCTDDTDCTYSGGICAASGKCVECEGDSDCTEDGEECISGECKTPCTKNEECPLLNVCEGGECIESGCTTDRECVALLGNRLAVCETVAGTDLKQCQVPCESNAECSSDELCENNVCTNIGCQSNEECRIQLGLANEGGSGYPWISTAVCK